MTGVLRYTCIKINSFLMDVLILLWHLAATDITLLVFALILVAMILIFLSFMEVKIEYEGFAVTVKRCGK